MLVSVLCCGTGQQPAILNVLRCAGLLLGLFLGISSTWDSQTCMTQMGVECKAGNHFCCTLCFGFLFEIVPDLNILFS